MKKVRPVRIEGDIAYITLTKGCVATIDACDAHLVDRFNWYALGSSTSIYAARSKTINGTRIVLLMHRVLMGVDHGVLIDHEDGDGLNNRMSTNLRLASHADNMKNRRTNANNKSGFKGVYLDKFTGRWASCIRLNGRTHHLGRFDTPEAAHGAYADASERLHGEFGRTS